MARKREILITAVHQDALRSRMQAIPLHRRMHIFHWLLSAKKKRRPDGALMYTNVRKSHGDCRVADKWRVSLKWKTISVGLSRRKNEVRHGIVVGITQLNRI